MDWQVDGDVWIEHDENGFAQQLRHIQSPFLVSGVTNPYRLAVDYLRAVRDELGLTDEQIQHLEGTIPPDPTTAPEGAISRNPGAQLRWSRYRAIRNETIVLIIQQTNEVPLRLDLGVGLPPLTSLVLNVFGSALRLVMHRQADRKLVITGVTSTLQHTFDFAHAGMLADTLPPLAAQGRPALGKHHVKTGADPAKMTGFITPALTEKLAKQVLDNLGLADAPDPSEATIAIYRYQPDHDGPSSAGVGALGLPRQRKRKREEMVPNSDYAVVIIRHLPFGYDDEFRVGLDSPPVDIVTRLPDFSVVAAIPLLAGARQPAATSSRVEGLVFPTDPITGRGYDIADDPPRRDRTLRPNRPSSELNVARKRVTLHRLDPPSGNPLRQKLRGSNVVVVEPREVAIGSVHIEPPTRPPGRDFDYDSRTNDFAAVNAYYHVDSMLHRLQLFGMPFATYAPMFNPRIDVIHRAAIRPGPGGDGRCVNAQVRIRPGVAGGTVGGVDPTLHTLEFRFALADLPPAPEINPLGIACDVRWVWHEFGHALIAGATGDLELPFAHSVGDALAAINCDPDSVLARPAWARWNLRGVTFPWVTLPHRRHDREAAQGWTWNGRLGQAAGYRDDHGDVAGYHREQVLSSTLFRLYRAIGGDAARANGAPEVDRRRRAADMITYLIVRALSSLGPASTIPAADASVFASAMMDADRGTPVFDYPGLPPDHVGQRRVGGRLHKVIRWAFEKQGLYARDDATAHGAGAPEPVDIYTDDGRQGEYGFTDDWTATRQAMWLRRQPDGGQTHQGPRKNQDNYIYVRVWNRGYDVAHTAQARVRVAPASSALGWPDAARWTELQPAPASTTTGDVGPNDQIVLGPFRWRPTRRGDYTILVELDVMGDRSNINASTGLPCALSTAEATPLRRLVPYDNNLGVTTWTVP